MNATHCINITREQGYNADRRRPYSVFVDGELVLQIREGESKQITVPPGAHSLSVRLDWCRSNTFTFDAESGQSTALWCWPNARVYNWPFFLLLRWNRYMTVSEQPKAARASAKSLFRIYQVGVAIAVFAFFGYESILGKTLAVAVLVSLLVAVMVWFMLRRARTGKDS
jgi:hypothetical protein